MGLGVGNIKSRVKPYTLVPLLPGLSFTASPDLHYQTSVFELLEEAGIADVRQGDSDAVILDALSNVNPQVTRGVVGSPQWSPSG